MVTEKNKVEIRGRKLPRFTYRVEKTTGKITLRRIAWVFIRLYRLLPERPNGGSPVMASKPELLRRQNFASRVNERRDADAR